MSESAPSRDIPTVNQSTVSLSTTTSTATQFAVKGVKFKTISITNPSYNETDKKSNAVTATQSRKESFTEEQMLNAWFSYIDTIPQKVHLQNTMRESVPSLKNDCVLEITVQNMLQESELKEIVYDLKMFISNQLRNDSLEILITVNAEIVASKTTSNIERFNNLQETKADFKSLVDLLHLTVFG